MKLDAYDLELIEWRYGGGKAVVVKDARRRLRRARELGEADLEGCGCDHCGLPLRACSAVNAADLALYCAALEGVQGPLPFNQGKEGV